MHRNYDKLSCTADIAVISDNEDNMPTTERELADDAQWKIIQKNTFTRWVNVHLKNRNTSISNLQMDFSDGLKLVALIEVLSGHKFTNVNKKPNFRTQKLENVTLVLKFLEEKEGLKIVNIDSSDIVDCRLKLILGLVWALILHYAISVPMWDGEEKKQETKQTPKQRMMTWFNGKMTERPIKNLTTDWNDGTAIGALVDSCAPGLCPDWDQWKPQNALENTIDAMETAEKWLNVPQLIKPEEMISPEVDEKAMMTYLSQFPNAKLNSAAPLRPKLNPKKIRVYGRGVESKDLVVDQAAEFTVDAVSAGRAHLEVEIIYSSNEHVKVTVEEMKEKTNCYRCVYFPRVKGDYVIHVKYNEQEVPHSPFKVLVEKSSIDINKVKVFGPGIEKAGVVVNTNTYFIISTEEAGEGEVVCIILDPQGNKDKIKAKITKISSTSYKVEYIAQETGTHSINVLFSNQQIFKSPFAVNILAKSCAKAITVTGKGIQHNGIRVEEEVQFTVNAEEADEGDLEVILTAEDGMEESVQVYQVLPNVYECTYFPKTFGTYELKIYYDGVSVPRSPFMINVLPSKTSNIQAYGPGLLRGVADKAAIFITDTNGDLGTLGFAIEGPSEAKIECSDNTDGSATICYWPKVEGEYAVHILCDGEDIPNSPFMAYISPKTNKSDISMIKVYGDGIQNGKVNLNKPNEFIIDCSDYKANFLPEACCYSSTGVMMPLNIASKNEKLFACTYSPNKIGNYKIFVCCDDQSVQKSPFKVTFEKPSDPNNIRVIGQGMKEATLHHPARFSIDTTNAGPGKLLVGLVDQIGNTLPVEINNKGDPEIFDVMYHPNNAGPTYTCTVLFDGVNVPGSPFKINILSEIDASKVTVDHLEKEVYVESYMRFMINTRVIDTSGKEEVKAIFTDPNNEMTVSMVKNNHDGTYSCSYTPYMTGSYQLDVTYGDLPIKNSPFKIQVVPGCDPNKISVYGDGLKGGITNQPNYFTLDLGSAGQGDLGFGIKGPSNAKICCEDNADGTCSVEYSSDCAGIYEIFVKFNEVDIKDFPIKVKICDPTNANNVKCHGQALNNDNLHRLGQPVTFVVDASAAGDAPIEIICMNDMEQEMPLQIHPRESSSPEIFDVTCIPTSLGLHSVNIKHGDISVPGGSFKFNVLPKSDPSKVKIYGDGIKPSKGFLTPSMPVQFHIDVSEAGTGDIQLSLSNPEYLMLPFDIIEEGHGLFCCQYIPVDAGTHSVTVSFDDVIVNNIPFLVDVSPVGDASKCFIEESMKEYAVIDTVTKITINTAEAGEGKVSCRILPLTENGEIKSNLSLPIEIEDNLNGKQSIYFTPTELTNYLLETKFGGVNIPNGQFQIKSVDSNNLPEEMFIMECNNMQQSSLDSDGLSGYSHGFYPVEFRLPISAESNVIEAFVSTPGGEEQCAHVQYNLKGNVIIRYEPKELGLHEMMIICDKVPIKGSPYRFSAEKAGLGKVVAYGPGLSHGQTGQASEFTVITKDAGPGGLSLAIEGPSKAELMCKNTVNGGCDVTYYPMVPGTYNVIVKYGDKNIPGSPFLVTVEGQAQKKSQICIGNTSEVSLNIKDLDISTLTASVMGPSNQEESCILKNMVDDNISVSFTPKEIGEHHINVYQSGSHITGSPFKINVGQSEIGDATKVKVSGIGLKTGNTGETNTFIVDTSEAGYGGLSLGIEGPSKADIECKDNYDGSCQVSYIPTVPGTYTINIKYSKNHVQGSPFRVKVSGEASTNIIERVIRRQETADITHVGSKCELALKIPGTNLCDMKATVTNEVGETNVCEIIDLDYGHYGIKFIPKVMGLHTVAVKHKIFDIPGSPFQFTVGPIVNGGAHKVVLSGAGLNTGVIDEYNEFSIYTREAGEGGLSIAIEGPSKAEICFEDRNDVSCGVKYKVTESGEYMCSIKFNGDHIVNSPFRIFVNDQQNYYLSVAAVGTEESLKELTIGQPASFTINYQHLEKSPSKLKATIKGPSNIEESGLISSIEKNQYAIRFIPKESGEHFISVVEESTKRHIQGSPFRIMIGEQHVDPSMVQAKGEGLKSAYVGQKSSFIVNTQSAGSGALNVTVDGPSKVQLYSQEHEEGYEFFYIPIVQGEYNITIKYGGNYNITGSPFKVEIKGSVSDDNSMIYSELFSSKIGSMSHKVHCKGSGLKKANLNQVNTFSVDTSEAGNDILFVGIAGPKGQCEQVTVKRVGNNQFDISYFVQEKGRHYLLVKWGEKNIPGSPFIVDVL